jgi:hypothetical protein
MGKREEVFANLSDEPVDFADIAREGAAAVTQPEEGAAPEAPQDPSPETEPEPPEPKPEEKEENLPFHKHPKWIRERRENEELRKKLEEIESRLSSQQAPAQPSPEEVPEEYRHVFGDDFGAYKAFQEFSRRQAEAILTEREKAALDERERKERENREFVEWADAQFAELSDDAGTDLTRVGNAVREKLLDIVEEIGLYDQSGRPNFRAALELHRLREAGTASAEKGARQALAAATSSPRTARGTDAGGPMTPSRLRGKSIESYFKD